MATALTIVTICGRRPLLPSTRSSSRTPVGFSSSINCRRLPKLSENRALKAVLVNEKLFEADAITAEEYSFEAELLQEFTNLPSIDKAWILNSENQCRAMFSISQTDLLANKSRKLVLSSDISKESTYTISFKWSPFPIEMSSASTIVPSPSGSKLLVVRNRENDLSTILEIWGPSHMEREIHIPKSVHGSLYTDGWFEGISWNREDTLIAYIAEDPSPSKPTFYSSSFPMNHTIWKGQGDWEEDWGETYTGKRKPSLFVLNVDSGEVRPVEGIADYLSVGQVIWAPSPSDSFQEYLVFVGWSPKVGSQEVARKLGMKVCYNRPCALYAARAPFPIFNSKKQPSSKTETQDLASATNLTYGLCSAFFPKFSPDGKFLVFMSAKTAVDSGAHAVTKSLHRMDWFLEGIPCPMRNIIDVVPVVMSVEDDCFPGLYPECLLYSPWLSDGHTMVMSSPWGSTQVIISINILSCRVCRVSPTDSRYSWNVLAIDGDHILALSSSPIDPPHIKYGYHSSLKKHTISWDWLDVSSPFLGCSEKVKNLLPSRNFSILKIPVKAPPENLTKGARKPFEAIFISLNDYKSEESCIMNKSNGASIPLILLMHGGPHSVSLSSYSKSAAFLSSLGYNLLIINYRGSVGFGEEALQSLPGNIGCQDVNDVLAALDFVTDNRLADASKVALYGSSHGGFLTAHLVGQAPDRFAAAAVRNPVCNLSLMIDTTDIPDWGYALAYGRDGQNFLLEGYSTKHLSLLHDKSPISHLSKVKAPILFILGAKDRRVPVSNGLQYAMALRERGVDVKVLQFPYDGHVRFRPQSEFESLLNLGKWFTKYCK